MLEKKTNNKADIDKTNKNKRSKSEVFMSKGSIETTRAVNQQESNSESVPDIV